MSNAKYLLVIYRCAQTDGEPVSPGRVAAELDRSPSTTTETLQRLADRGLLAYEPYDGVRLTDEGRETAAELHDSYCIFVRFFRDILALEAPETEAMELAGSISPLVVDRLASTVLGAGTVSEDSSHSVASEGSTDD